MKKVIRLTESDLLRIVKKVVSEQLETLDIKTISNIFKSKGYKIGQESGYSFWAHKETTGPIHNPKTGEYYWNYEAYIPSGTSQLWVDRRRQDSKGNTESENIIIDLNGDNHKVITKKNGRTITTDNIPSNEVITMLNNYKASF